MNTPKLGERDAVHMPTIWVQAHRTLQPGERVGVRGNRTCAGDLGITHPFEGMVVEGGLVCVLIPTDKTEGVRHVWRCSQIDNGSESIDSVILEAAARQVDEQIATGSAQPWDEYIAALSERIGVDSTTILEAAHYRIDQGTGVGGIQPSGDRAAVDREDWALFWRKYRKHYKDQRPGDDWADDPFCCIQ